MLRFLVFLRNRQPELRLLYSQKQRQCLAPERERRPAPFCEAPWRGPEEQHGLPLLFFSNRHREGRSGKTYCTHGTALLFEEAIAWLSRVRFQGELANQHVLSK